MYRRNRVYLQIHLEIICVCLKLGMVTTNTSLFQTQQAQTWRPDLGDGASPLALGPYGALIPQPPNLTQPKDGHPIVNS